MNASPAKLKRLLANIKTDLLNHQNFIEVMHVYFLQGTKEKGTVCEFNLYCSNH